uniref:Putative endodeoxyribonuclease n=1 Tax=viral metagenome TaxID=1070528 RepID=A0A6M3JBR1_9ZZZZ
MSATLQTLQVWAEREQALTFFVVGVPRPQKRARAGLGAGGHARVYNERPGPKASNSTNLLFGWKSRVTWATKLAIAAGWAPVPDGVPVEVSLDFYFLPKRGAMSLTQWDKVVKCSTDRGCNPQTFWRLHADTPDRDNLDKAVLDTITAIGAAGVWHDDRQAALGRVVKWWSNNYAGALIHLATGKSISEIERPNPESVPILDFDDGPGLARFR